MLLSEAIRLGGALGPQCFGVSMKWVLDETGKPIHATCAIQGAVEAVGEELYNRIYDEFVKASHPSCPLCTTLQYDIIIHLNDVHRLSRNQIADFIAGIEREKMIPEVEEEHAIQESSPEREISCVGAGR